MHSYLSGFNYSRSSNEICRADLKASILIIIDQCGMKEYETYRLKQRSCLDEKQLLCLLKHDRS